MSTDLIHQISLVEERLRLAMLASDCPALSELISLDLIFTNHLGQVCGKQDDLNMHRDGLLKLHTLEPSEVRVKARGDLAMVSVRMKVGGAFDNMTFQEDLRYTRVWGLSEGVVGKYLRATVAAFSDSRDWTIRSLMPSIANRWLRCKMTISVSL